MSFRSRARLSDSLDRRLGSLCVSVVVLTMVDGIACPILYVISIHLR